LVRSIARAIEATASRQSEALFVTLGSQGNPGIQHDLNRIASNAREILAFLDKPTGDFDVMVMPFERFARAAKAGK